MLETHNRWDFGLDSTGDVTHPDYPDWLLHRFGGRVINLVTADGSFNCRNPDSSILWLYLKETLVALNILRLDKIPICESSDIGVENHTFQLWQHDLYNFYARFRRQNAFIFWVQYYLPDVSPRKIIHCCWRKKKKTAISKECNSEVYVICRVYKGIGEAQMYLSTLRQINKY
jgi:hypothetical protein